MPFGLHMRTPVPSITSRASVQFPAQNMKESRSASLTWYHFVALSGHFLEVLPNFVQEVWSWDSGQECSSCHWRSLHMQMGQVKHWCAFLWFSLAWCCSLVPDWPGAESLCHVSYLWWEQRITGSAPGGLGNAPEFPRMFAHWDIAHSLGGKWCITLPVAWKSALLLVLHLASHRTAHFSDENAAVNANYSSYHQWAPASQGHPLPSSMPTWGREMWTSLTGPNFWYFRALTQHEMIPAVHLPTGGLGAAQGHSEHRRCGHWAVAVRSEGWTLLLPSALSHQCWFAGVRAEVHPYPPVCWWPARQQGWGHRSCHSISVSRKATSALQLGTVKWRVRCGKRGWGKLRRRNRHGNGIQQGMGV